MNQDARDKPVDASAGGNGAAGNEGDADDGDLADTLSELRVLLPSAQLLTAFMITVPFNPGFAAIVASEKAVFLATFLLAMVSLILLSAPAVQHRLIRPLINRVRFKHLASRQIVVGSVTLAFALTLSTYLVLTQVFGHVTGLLSATLIGTAIATLWWALPKLLKQRGTI